jgi:hypothetical protein
MPATITPTPSDFGSGGKGLSPSAPTPEGITLASKLQEHDAALGTGAAGKFQTGTATLVAGTATVDTTIVLTANSKIQLTWAERPTIGGSGTGVLARVATTPGAAGVAEFTIEALEADGTIDAGAAGDVDWTIVD